MKPPLPERRPRFALLLAALSVLACNTLAPRSSGTPAAATASPVAQAAVTEAPALATAGPQRTPVVFATNTRVPRPTEPPTATPGIFIEEVFGLPRAETLILLGLPPAAAALDPATTTGAADGYIGHLYSGLVRLDPSLQLEPDLAESWTVSPDGLTYTFTLRASLTFSSGRPLTAADVQYSWERAADPATGSPTAVTYLGDIAGLRARADGSAPAISGLAVPNDRTLVVTLEQPRTQFVAKLTYPVAFVVDRDNVESGPQWMFQPSASGPFALRALDPAQAIVFERNPGYHTPAGVPYLAYLFVPFDLSGLLYEAGEIDLGYVDAQTAARVRSTGDPLAAEWVTTTALCTLMLRLDLNNPPLDDPLVRQALVQSLDRAALRTNLAGPEAVLAETVLPPDLPGYSADLPRLSFDLDGARAALAASQYASAMPPITLADPGSAGQPSRLGAAVAAMWRANLGLTVNIQPLSTSAQPAPGASHGHAIVYSWCADYPDPENFLEVLFHSGSRFNVAAYANPQVDAWLDEARAHPDPAQRLALYHQVEAQVLSDMAVIPWLHPTYERLVKPYVKNFVLAPMGVPILHRVTLEHPAP